MSEATGCVLHVVVTQLYISSLKLGQQLNNNV